MLYRFFHAFDGCSREEARCSTLLSDDEKIAIARDAAARDLAKELMSNAVFEITPEGHVKGYVKIGE